MTGCLLRKQFENLIRIHRILPLVVLLIHLIADVKANRRKAYCSLKRKNLMVIIFHRMEHGWRLIFKGDLLFCTPLKVSWLTNGSTASKGKGRRCGEQKGSRI